MRETCENNLKYNTIIESTDATLDVKHRRETLNPKNEWYNDESGPRDYERKTETLRHAVSEEI